MFGSAMIVASIIMLILYLVKRESFIATPFRIPDPQNSPAGDKQYTNLSQTDLNSNYTSYLPNISSALSNQH